jgi:hypothetical protein
VFDLEAILKPSVFLTFTRRFGLCVMGLLVGGVDRRARKCCGVKR